MKADQTFQIAKAGEPSLSWFESPAGLLEYLAVKTRRPEDHEEKNTIYRAFVRAVQERVAWADLASALLWLGLWPGLDAVYRRRLRHFRDQPDELVAELAEVFTELVDRLDLAVVHRVAATLVRSTERDVMERRKRAWAQTNQDLEDDSLEPLRDMEGNLVRASWFDQASLLRWTASGTDITGLSFAGEVAVLRAWLRPIVGADAELLLAMLVLDDTQREAGQRLGLSYDAARKRFQRAFRRIREHLANRCPRAAPNGGFALPANR